MTKEIATPYHCATASPSNRHSNTTICIQFTFTYTPQCTHTLIIPAKIKATLVREQNFRPLPLQPSMTPLGPLQCRLITVKLSFLNGLLECQSIDRNCGRTVDADRPRPTTLCILCAVLADVKNRSRKWPNRIRRSWFCEITLALSVWCIALTEPVRAILWVRLVIVKGDNPSVQQCVTQTVLQLLTYSLLHDTKYDSASAYFQNLSVCQNFVNGI